MGGIIDLTGQTFGRLTVLKSVGKNKRNKIIWNCLCECGKETNVLGYRLKGGTTRSCGCLKADTTRARLETHGCATKDNRTVEYKCWTYMIKRCNNQKDKDYKYYGGRGITVCDRWLHSFENFLSDMKEKPSPKHSIDRIDNERGYDPSNCKWSTHVEQIGNQRMHSDNPSGCKGVSWIKKLSKWVSYVHQDGKQIRLGSFDSLSEAIVSRRNAEIIYYGKSS